MRSRPKQIDLVIKFAVGPNKGQELLRMDLRSLAAMQDLMAGKDLLEVTVPVAVFIERNGER